MYFMIFGLLGGALFAAGLMKVFRVDMNDDSVVTGTTLIFFALWIVSFSALGFGWATRMCFERCMGDEHGF